MLYVPAVPFASYTSIESPTDAEAGKVKVLVAEVFTKYLLLAANVVFVDIADDAGPVAIVVLDPKDTAVPLIVIAEFVREEFEILVKVLDAPDIVLLVRVSVPVSVIALGRAEEIVFHSVPSHTLIVLAISKFYSFYAGYP
jgi:hypothetical protein